MKPPIHMWFDFASPNAYFALDAAERLAAAHGREIEWRPILGWAVLKGQSIPPPMDPPARRAYFLADMARSAAFYDVPYRAPTKFPLSAHRAARLYYALAEEDNERAFALGRDLFSAYFAADVNISETVALTEIAARHGMTSQAAMAAPEGENRTRATCRGNRPSRRRRRLRLALVRGRRRGLLWRRPFAADRLEAWRQSARQGGAAWSRILTSHTGWTARWRASG
jgi:2-hydroxychromene-2-carboxylate isomerase